MTSPDFLNPVAPLNTAAMEEATQRWATRAMPPGSLGRLQELGTHLAGVTGTCPPRIVRPAVAVFAGDNQLVADGHDCLVGGEMGIGNTTPSAALIAVSSGEFVDSLIGPGAGLPDEQLPRKQQLVSDALDRLTGEESGVELLAQVGGLEIAALAGFYCAAAAAQVPFVIDGVIAAAALCAAERLVPGVAALAVAGHQSSEPAATAALMHLGLTPLLDLDLRLGEGTGACLAVPLLQAACRTMAEIADLPEL